jgi:hypothetical protein
MKLQFEGKEDRMIGAASNTKELTARSRKVGRELFFPWWRIWQVKAQRKLD